MGEESGRLVIFDKRRGIKPVEERTESHKAVTPSGKRVVVLRAKFYCC